MKLTLTKILVTVLGAAIIAAAVLFREVKALKADLKVSKANEVSLMQGVKNWKTEAGHNASQVKALTLEKKKINHLYGDVLKELEIKENEVRTFGNMIMEMELSFKKQFEDSTYFTPVTFGVDTAKKAVTNPCLNYYDGWTDLSVCVEENKFGKLEGDVNFSTSDSIFTAGSVTYKRKLWFRCPLWGVESVEQTVLNFNPESTVTYNRFIQLK